jgi:hypothetical protein
MPFLTTSQRSWDVVLRLTFFPKHPPAHPLVVWCFFSRFKTTFVIFLTFLGYLGLSWASKLTGTRSSERASARARFLIFLSKFSNFFKTKISNYFFIFLQKELFSSVA